MSASCLKHLKQISQLTYWKRFVVSSSEDHPHHILLWSNTEIQLKVLQLVIGNNKHYCCVTGKEKWRQTFEFLSLNRSSWLWWLTGPINVGRQNSELILFSLCQVKDSITRRSNRDLGVNALPCATVCHALWRDGDMEASLFTFLKCILFFQGLSLYVLYRRPVKIV